ncbi:PulJ/GspJ family protein [Ramlibacter albus]|uniref:Prepilin-type N-terminal cleavage/methylation domain-containing protein n=1 Tax=Ramlibacter albus TaxID=2079448 RepID=A0A923M6S3_9BURK|nr:prepilin-type N-terminal cleavage/methylation domain-containing protein [Ramlibacter albus]MBC5765015.1 prepilin-type N-terminal cleavage/methylation domain-containing protein [Ramlibacter albus]
MKTARGFTLVELLVAIFALSLMAMLSWRGLDGMSRAQAQTSARADEVLALQTGLAQWSADLDTLVQFPQLAALEWNGRVLRLTRRDTTSATEGVHVVAWARREGQWRRWQSPPLLTRGDVTKAWEEADLWSQNQGGDEQLRREVVVAPLEEWQVFYYRGDAWTNPMSSDASGPGMAPNPFAAAAAAAVGAAGRTGRVALVPDGVRIVITLPPGQALTGRITRDWVNPQVGGGKS